MCMSRAQQQQKKQQQQQDPREPLTIGAHSLASLGDARDWLRSARWSAAEPLTCCGPRGAQINCTFYSAVGNNDGWYLLARAIQLFTPGVPLIYYVGLLAGKNDIELVERTKVGRDINRHPFSLDEAVAEMERPVVKARRRRRGCCAGAAPASRQGDSSPLAASAR